MTGESSRKKIRYCKPRPRNYRVLHRAYNPRPQADGCMLGVKPDNLSASACNILIKPNAGLIVLPKGSGVLLLRNY